MLINNLSNRGRVSSKKIINVYYSVGILNIFYTLSVVVDLVHLAFKYYNCHVFDSV